MQNAVGANQMPPSPLVTVVIPTHNRVDLLRAAVVSAQAQNLPVEIVVVDDGSTDGTAAWLKTAPEHVRFALIPEPSGPQRARNIGLSQARGVFIKFLDDDDILLPDALARETETAERTGADLVASGWDEEGFDGLRTAYPAPAFGSIPDDLLAGRAVPTGAALYRRTAIAGLAWDPLIRRLDDWDWFVGAALAARKVASCAVSSYRWRHHAGSRVTTRESQTQLVHDFYAILSKLERTLRTRGEMTPSRQRRLAQYLYKELRWLARLEPSSCDEVLAKIQALDSDFLPVDEEPSKIIRLSCSIVGVRATVRSVGAIRRGLDRLQPQAPRL